MKNYLSFLIATLLIVGTSCHHEVNVEKEKEAILKVLQEESNEFAANNKEKVFDTYIQDETATRLEGPTVYSGWEKIKKINEDHFIHNQADTLLVNPQITKENIITKVTGNSAWVVCDNIWKWEINEQAQGVKYKQIAALEKIDGDWKIALNAFVEEQYPNDKLLGAWNMVAYKNVNNGSLAYSFPNGNVTGKQIKVWTNGHFTFSGEFEFDGEKTDNYGGGSYTMNGNISEEYIEYFSSKPSIGTTVKLMMEFKGDTLIQTYPVDADGNFDKNNYSVEKYVKLD